MTSDALRLLSVFFQPLAERKAVARRIFGRQTSGIRRGRRWWRAEQFFQDPFTTQHRARSLRVGGQRQHTAHAEHTATIAVRQFDAAEIRAGYVGDAIMRGEGFVHEGMIGIEQREQASSVVQQ